MLVAGIAWGFYSILAKNMQHALTATLSNFLFALPLVAMLFLWHLPESFITWQGVVLAVLSGCIGFGWRVCVVVQHCEKNRSALPQVLCNFLYRVWRF